MDSTVPCERKRCRGVATLRHLVPEHDVEWGHYECPCGYRFHQRQGEAARRNHSCHCQRPN
jgi:hypothetical protein